MRLIPEVVGRVIPLLIAVLALYQANLASAHDDDRQPGVVVGERLDGYRGVWHGQEPTKDEYHFKYSGGLGTYTANHRPIAIYAPPANKTYFVYGGTLGTGRDRLVAMIGAYDHANGEFERPTLVHHKNTFDPHDNPALSIDEAGHLWVFISGRARGRAGWMYRSEKPYDLEKFKLIDTGEYTYPQPWHVPGKGFFFLFTKYLGGRQLFFKKSADGVKWSDDTLLAGFEGHYQTSCHQGGRIATTFNWHPKGNVDDRTNLYYVETHDLGRTWQNAAGESIELPLNRPDNPCLVRDYHAEGKRIYGQDLRFDDAGHPVILYTVSGAGKPGPEGDPRTWTVARHNGREWEFHDVTTSDHNYDLGLLDIEGDRFRILGPTEPGPSPYHTGGEVALWESNDAGVTWKKTRDVTSNSKYAQTYVRQVLNGRPDFYALWADGDPAKMTPSHLYFCDEQGAHVWQLPDKMEGPTAKPIKVR